jgi:hypothetical protein
MDSVENDSLPEKELLSVSDYSDSLLGKHKLNKEKQNTQEDGLGNIDEYTGEIIFHRKGSLVASTVGRVRDVVTAVLLGDFGRILNPFTNKEKDELERTIRERFKNIHFKDDLHIYLGASGFRERYKQEMKDRGERLSLWDRIRLRLEDFGINFSRADAYSPYTNTISIFDEKYSTVAHEIGHAIDYNAYEAQNLRETSSQKEKGKYDYLNDERIASNFAMRFMTPKERKKYSGDLAAAYGTYQGGTVAGAVSPFLVAGAYVTRNPYMWLAALLAPIASTSIGAYAQRIRNVFRRNKDQKNTILDVDQSRDIDTNPYWDGMFGGNTVEEQEVQPVGDLQYQSA